MVKYCINCGEELPDKAKFCSECGTAQASKGDLAASVGRDMSGQMQVAGRDVHVHDAEKTSQLLDCRICMGTGVVKVKCRCDGRGWCFQTINKLDEGSAWVMGCPDCGGSGEAEHKLGYGAPIWTHQKIITERIKAKQGDLKNIKLGSGLRKVLCPHCNGQGKVRI
jgi:hypothetical protein